MMAKIQRSWRQFRDVTVTWSSQADLETTICGARVSFAWTPLYIQLILRIYAATGGGVKTDFAPGRRKP